MIRVMHVITGLGVGGAETMLCKLLQDIDHQEFASTVVTLTSGGALEDNIRTLGIPIHDLGMRPGVPNPIAVLRLVRLLRRERPHVLQTWLYHADLLGVAAAALARTPAVAWNIRRSTMDARYSHGLKGIVLRLLARLSFFPDVVVANSDAGIAAHKQLGYRPRRWEMIPNGFDLRRFHPSATARGDVRRELKLADDALLIGLVARYDPQKNHEAFLRAAVALRATHDASFVLVGPGVSRSNLALTNLVADLELASEVLLLGERTDIPRLTAALDVATCSSAGGEGFPNVLGEAMACGVPVVTTDVGDTATIVGDAGVIAREATPAAIAAGWRSVLDLPTAERRRLGERARRRVAERYDLKVVAGQYAAMYRDLARQ